MKFENIEGNDSLDDIINDYKYYIKQINDYEDAYLLADFVFMLNFSNIIREKNLKYIFNIYMFEGSYFMVHLKKEKGLIEEVKIHKNKCKNEMLSNESEKLNIKELEIFISKYLELLSLKDFFSLKDNTKCCRFPLFDFNCRINYILNLYINPKNNNNDDNKEKKNYAEIISIKKAFNIIDDNISLEAIEQLVHLNIIFIRKTEFGERFNKEKIKSLIKYLFNLNDTIVVDNFEETKELTITQDKYYGNNRLVIIRKENSMLPIFVKPDKEINQSIIPLIEYNYFLSIPLLLNKKEDKPNVLILANDFGLLNYYYHELYKDKFNISSFMEKKEAIIDKKEFFNINNNDIKISDFQNVLDEKKKNIKKEKFDIILIEYFDKKDKNDKIIPNFEIINDWKNILNNEGILAFNLRTESIKIFNETIKKLEKEYTKVIVIYLRPCSGIVFCGGNNGFKIVNYYAMTETLLQKYLNDLIKSNLVEKEKTGD